jgi:tetratricopeptide (TPR) repeat protein
MKQLARLASILSLLVVCLASVQAQTPDSPDEKTDKQKAKEARIEEYLRKKEQRLAEKEAREFARQEEKAAALAAADDAASGAEAVTPSSQLPRQMAMAQQAVRASSVGQDPTVQHYLEMIEQQEASAYELAAFGNFLAESGLRPEALVYYSVAIDMVRDDPILWLNLASLHRQLGNYPEATSAYGRVLKLDPNNALAHYNLGTIYDAQKKYEDAIEAYTVALTLDPSLGDPEFNPQAANNQRLLAVKLMLYQQGMGSLGTPLVNIPEEKLSTGKADDKTNPDD